MRDAEMKILFVNLPYHGHVIPTVGLTQNLIKAGHQVTYLMPHDWEEQIAESGADFLGYETGPKLNRTAMALMRDIPIRENLKMIQKEIALAPGNTGAVGIIEAYYDKQRNQLG